MSAPSQEVPAPLATGVVASRPNDLRILWLIARRGALESLRDRLTLLFNLFFVLVFPIGLVLMVIRAQVATVVAAGRLDLLGSILVVYVLSIGLLPATGAVGIASGQFAGEKEQGSLAPILASPASNFAIFGGKILGSVLPALGFAVVAEAVYLTSLAVVVGADKVRLLPVGLALALLALVPAVAVFAATVASLISSRVRTYNTAQQIGGLALVPFWAGVFGLTLKVRDWGPWAFVGIVIGLFAVDAALIALAAATWRREEVLAQR
jgi:ABC-type Na+ efflux pump permease subunit